MASTTPNRLTPYLAVHDGAAALAFYVDALGAQETMRVTMDDGRVGHAELRIGEVTVFLSDEFPDIGVVSPRTLGGTTITLHLEVPDVDAAFARVVAAGAVAHTAPADQPHGARHGTLVDPFGHRWMLSQELEVVKPADFVARMQALGASATVAAAARGGIWPAINYVDAPAAIRFLVDVFGFVEKLVVAGDAPGVIDHSELRWPEGGIVQAATADRRGNPYSVLAIQSLYVITADPLAVWARCSAAGLAVVHEPAAPHDDPEGLIFSVRDPEGHLWSFGTYNGE